MEDAKLETEAPGVVPVAQAETPPVSPPAFTPNPEELRIVAQCIAGEPQGFALLHEKYSGLLACVLRKMLRDEHRVADVLQDVFVRLMEKRERFSSFRGDSKLGTWLTRIAINIATTMMKKSKKMPDGIKLTKKRMPITPPDVECERVETFEKIDRAISEVPEDLRKLLLQDESLSYGEIATILGLTENQVRGGLYRARQMFRVAFEREKV